MKKLLALGLAAAMTVTGACLLASCNESGNGGNGGNGGNDSITVGFIALHDSSSTYDKNFIDAIEAACEKKGVELIMKTGIPEDNNCILLAMRNSFYKPQRNSPKLNSATQRVRWLTPKALLITTMRSHTSMRADILRVSLPA